MRSVAAILFGVGLEKTASRHIGGIVVEISRSQEW